MYNDSFRQRYGTAPIAIHETVGYMPTHPHIHSEIELLYIVKGCSRIKISDMSYDARPGDLFIVNPLEVHSVIMEKEEPYSHRCICFDCSLIAEKQLAEALLDGFKSVPHHFKKDEQTTIKLVALFGALFQAVEESTDALLFESSASISLIFAELIRKKLIREHPQKNKSSDLSKVVIEYLAKHYFENLTSKMIAEKLGFTQSYFCRMFKENFGVPFSAYLNMYRILIAKKKLWDTSRSIAAISLECGFSDVAYFTKCFRKSVGTTPLKYRKSQHSHKK